MRLTKIHRITLLILVFVVCLMPVSGQTYNPDSTDAYVFPFDYKNMPDHIKALTSKERHQLLQVPDSLLKTMSTEGLIETCLNAPGGIGLGGALQGQFNGWFGKLNYLPELLSRENVGTKLIERYRQMDLEAYAQLPEERQSPEGRKRFLNLRKLRRVELLLAQEAVLSSLQKKERRNLLELCVKIISVKRKYPEGYITKYLEQMTWVLAGRIMLAENYKLFVESIKTNNHLKLFIEQDIPDPANVSESVFDKAYKEFYATYSEPTVRDNVLGIIELSIEQYLRLKSKGDEK